MERRLRAAQERAEAFLRDWEWTWARAFLVGLGVSLLALITLAVVPSWWINFADQTLRWRDRWPWLTIRDAIVTVWLVLWGGVFVVTFYRLQVIRRRLRGERQAERYSGGYR